MQRGIEFPGKIHIHTAQKASGGTIWTELWDRETAGYKVYAWVLLYGVCVIQKRVAYFDYTAALGGSFAVLSHAVLPSFALPASLVRPRWHLGMEHVAGWRRSFASSNLRRSAHRRSRR